MRNRGFLAQKYATGTASSRAIVRLEINDRGLSPPLAEATYGQGHPVYPWTRDEYALNVTGSAMDEPRPS